MGLTVHINYEAEIKEWIDLHPSFEFIKDIKIPRDSKHTWNINDNYWGYVNKTSYQLQIMFIGKTGYGKSTTLNKLVGKQVFETSDINVCTKDLYNSMYRIDSKTPSFLAISDLPGVGESNYADNSYYEWYKEMLEYSNVVVYVLRADQRDFAVDEMIFSNLFKNSDERSKIVIALNYADKVEPLNRKRELSNEQLLSLKRKIKEVSRIFNFPQNDIIYYSATDELNLDILEKKISQKLKDNI